MFNVENLGYNPEETEAERKAREKQQILESDLQNAQDLFGGLSVNKGSFLHSTLTNVGVDQAPKPAASNESLFETPPTSAAEFEQLAKKFLENVESLRVT